MDIALETYYGDNRNYWSLTFVGQGFMFTEADLQAVRDAVEGRGDSGKRRVTSARGGPSGTWRAGWNGQRRSHLYVSCMEGEQIGLGRQALQVLQRRYPKARFTTYSPYFKQKMGDPVVVIRAS